MQKNYNDNPVIKVLRYLFPVTIAFILFIFIMNKTSPSNPKKEDLTLNDQALLEENNTTDESVSENDITNEFSDTTQPSVDDYEELSWEIIKEGTGSEVKAGDNLKVHYKGTLIDGTKFDSSYDRNTPFDVVIGEGNVIPGWDQGVIGMKVGEIRKLQIPSSLGYGTTGSGTIPPNAGLIFEIELLEIL